MRLKGTSWARPRFIVPNVLKGILDRYKKFSLFCDLIHINIIGFLNNISQQIMFSTGIIIKNKLVKNIEDGIKLVIKLYLHCGF